jgi:hypothetical protein
LGEADIAAEVDLELGFADACAHVVGAHEHGAAEHALLPLQRGVEVDAGDARLPATVFFGCRS